MTTTTLQKFIYAKRPRVPGSYHVWTRDRSVYIGCVYRHDDVRGEAKWSASGGLPTHRTRESAAHELLEAVEG